MVVVGGTVVVVVDGRVLVADVGTWIVVVVVEVAVVVDEQAAINSATPTRIRLLIGSCRAPDRRQPDAV